MSKSFTKLGHKMREWLRDNIIEPTDAQVEKILKVKRIKGQLAMKKDICYDTKWSKKYYSNTDLMVMVRVKNSKKIKNLASVIPCNVDHGTFRPISALLTINIHRLLPKGKPSLDTDFNKRSQRTILFEIIHSMNFAHYQFHYF